MSEWEPSEESVLNAYRRLQSSIMLTTEVAAEAIKVAVATDPLLSAAKEMQTFVADVYESIRDGNLRVIGKDSAWFEDRLSALLAKSRGEQ